MALSKGNLSNLIIAFATLFLDAMNYALIVPVLPILVKEFNSTSFQQGILYSSYSVFQLISLLIAGPLSDKYGRKPFLILSLIGSCFGSFLQAISRNMWELLLWRSITGLFAGSLILVQAVVADVTDVSCRNSWLARLEGVLSFSTIVGPAIGAVLLKVNSRFPLFFAGVVSGIALLVACIFLKESHPRKVNTTENPSKETEKKPEKTPKPKVTRLMLCCFVFEFCNRWSLNAFDSRYGYFLMDKFNAPEDRFAMVVMGSSIVSFTQQFFIYPWIVEKKNVPIIYLTFVGVIIETIGYIGMSAFPTQAGSIVAAFVLWIGFCFASPMPVSVISTTTSKDIQGTVLSWNNFCNQASLIVSPVILSTIYSWNIDATYYVSSLFGFVAIGIAGYLCTLKNAKTLGKTSGESVPEIEMKDIEGAPEEVSNKDEKEVNEVNNNDEKEVNNVNEKDEVNNNDDEEVNNVNEKDEKKENDEKVNIVVITVEKTPNQP